MVKMRKALLIGGLLGSAMACAQGDFRVAGSDGAAIQRAVDQAAAAGGGRVVVPAGDYPSGSLRLYSHVELHLEAGARIVGSARADDYLDFPADVCDLAPERSRKVFVYAWDATDIAITGEGTIDGQGPKFFDTTKLAWEGRFWGKPAQPRPRMVQFVRCTNVRLEGVTFKDSPGWAMLLRLCADVRVDGIVVDSEQRMINSDGIDFDGCRRVRVVRSRFRTGDDCLIVRAMRERGSSERIVSEDIVFEDCDLDSACQTIRMGCPSDDTIRNVTIRNIRATGHNGIFFDYPVRYLTAGDRGFMDISDVTVDGYRGSFTGSAVQIVVEPGVRLRQVRDIAFRNVDIRSAQPLRFLGNADTPLVNVTFEGVEVANCVFTSRGVRRSPVRIVTYNIRHGAGMDGRMDLARQAALVEPLRPHYVALQEVDVGTARAHVADQANELARLLGLTATFAEAIPFRGGSYGVAILSREQPLAVERLPIPDSQENRVLLVCEFADCLLASTHLSVATERDRETGLAVIRQRLARGCDKPFFLCGDLNATPDSKVIAELSRDFALLSRTDRATYIGHHPTADVRENDRMRVLDYVFVDRPHAASLSADSRVVGEIGADAPSDHRPVAVNITTKEMMK